MYNQVKDLWKQANLHPLDAPDIPTLSFRELASRSNLLHIYACAAYAKIYYNVDVLKPIIKEYYFRRTKYLCDMEGWEQPHVINIPHSSYDHTTRSYRMKDHRMHRLFMPLNLAIEQCDKAKPQILSYYIADYLAGTIPTYAAVPTMLKNAQDLEAHLIPIEGLDKSHLLDWTKRSLNLIDGIRDLITELQTTGLVVSCFPSSPTIPKAAIRDTYIVDILNAIALSDWGEASVEILEWAGDAREDLEAELERA
ncbi:hypothetical protein M422DRAFT_29447 [Sphaerobolus stellatus SS14]|uniref:Uncharacterized protein n=1 Tax=Sphaerobolus stellatus (strain SS14) TaxID=990650 RepID=A0A0C9W441_SPHS4|nr:hypothetical protein M422DRAFT_29447 [Sphaerobolus stellatus SS14]